MKIHKSVTLDRVMEACEADDNLGICIACGEDCGMPCEPDARNYECDSCGKHSVFGAEELLLELA